jgi:uncharacterized protein with HEPN domain
LNEKIIKYMQDILDCISNIDGFFVSGEKTFKSFSENTLIRQATERNFEIIGEATSRIKKINSDINIRNNKQIINLRNLIIHSYDNINHQVLWAIVINDLPKLKTEVEELIAGLKN